MAGENGRPLPRSVSGFLVLLLLGSSVAFASVTVTVTSNADFVTPCAATGVPSREGCTLRDAILFSNANPPAPPAWNLIDFNIPGSGVQTITLGANLPPITAAVVIDGYTQPGSSPNTLAVGSDAVLLIFVDGENVHSGVVLDVAGGAGSVLRGLAVTGGSFLDLQNIGSDALHLDSCCNRVIGNFVGTDPSGTVRLVGGLLLGPLSATNQIGSPSPADRNVFSNSTARFDSIAVVGDRNSIQGNYIGTNAAGNAVLSDAIYGIEVIGSFNVVGGFGGRGNVISGGSFAGILLGGGDGNGTGNIVSGNFLGTDATGALPIPNDFGILIIGSGNVVGTPPGLPILGALYPGNRIAFNLRSGIRVEGPFPFNSALTDRNSIRFNSIFSNGGLGIDLTPPSDPGVGDNVTANDPCDDDTGGNDLQNFPVLTEADVLKFKTKIFGTLNSKPNTTYDVQLFSNQACDPSGFGEGETLVGEVFVTTDGSCNASFSAAVPLADAPAGSFITSTATDPDGNTSEFSACIQVRPLTPLTRTRFLVEGPIRVLPGVPVEFAIKVETTPPGLAGDLSGEVVVSDGVGDACRAPVSASGEGACALTFGAPGHYQVRAQYLGNDLFDGSTSPPQNVIVEAPGAGSR